MKDLKNVPTKQLVEELIGRGDEVISVKPENGNSRNVLFCNDNGERCSVDNYSIALIIKSEQ